jgi:hypothetical protein
MTVLKKRSELLNCARPHRFLICSLPANSIRDLIVSGAISATQGPMTIYLPGGVIFPACFLVSSNSSGVAFKCSAAPPRKSGVLWSRSTSGLGAVQQAQAIPSLLRSIVRGQLQYRVEESHQRERKYKLPLLYSGLQCMMVLLPPGSHPCNTHRGRSFNLPASVSFFPSSSTFNKTGTSVFAIKSPYQNIFLRSSPFPSSNRSCASSGLYWQG